MKLIEKIAQLEKKAVKLRTALGVGAGIGAGAAIYKGLSRRKPKRPKAITSAVS